MLRKVVVRLRHECDLLLLFLRARPDEIRHPLLYVSGGFDLSSECGVGGLVLVQARLLPRERLSGPVGVGLQPVIRGCDDADRLGELIEKATGFVGGSANLALLLVEGIKGFRNRIERFARFVLRPNYEIDITLVSHFGLAR